MKLNKMVFDDKKIEEAANLHRFELIASMHGSTLGTPMQCFEEVVDAETDLIEDSFITGAKWAINEFLKNLWHPNTEEPDKSKSDIITLGFDNDAYLQFKESILWKEESWRHSISRCQIIKWAYLSDILPKQEGGEQ